MQGYKTIVTAALSLIFGVLQMFGYVIDPTWLAQLNEQVTIVVGAIIAIYGIVMIILRAFTKTPIGQQDAAATHPLDDPYPERRAVPGTGHQPEIPTDYQRGDPLRRQ